MAEGETNIDQIVDDWIVPSSHDLTDPDQVRQEIGNKLGSLAVRIGLLMPNLTAAGNLKKAAFDRLLNEYPQYEEDIFNQAREKKALKGFAKSLQEERAKRHSNNSTTPSN